MALIKKADVAKYFAERRAMRNGTKLRVNKPDVAATEPAAGAADAPRSVENFTPGHSSLGGSSAAIPIAADSGPSRLLRPPGSRQNRTGN